LDQKTEIANIKFTENHHKRFTEKTNFKEKRPKKQKKPLNKLFIKLELKDRFSMIETDKIRSGNVSKIIRNELLKRPNKPFKDKFL